MAWFKGTATDYKDLMDQLAALGEDEHVATAVVYDGGSGYAVDEVISITGGSVTDAPELEVISIESGDTVNVPSIVAGGTGYTVGDTLNIDGGTYTQQCVLEVTTEAAGVVTGLQVNNPGVYSVQPAGTLTTTIISGTGNDDLTVTVTWNTTVTGICTGVHISNAGAYTSTPASPVATTASASGTGLKLTTTYVETAWETLDLYDYTEAVSAVVAAGGTGHSVGDKLTAIGGTYTDAAAVFTVATEAAGVVTSVTLDEAGGYNTVPGNPVSTTSNGVGVSCTLTVTWDTTTSRRLYLHNTNSDVYIGIRTEYNATYTAYTWKLAGFTGYTSASIPWDTQPGYSNDGVCYVSLANTPINFWFAVNDNRIVGMFEVGSSFPSMYMGLLEPFLTAAEYPYPLMILASNTRPRPASESIQGGMINPGAYSNGTYEGPGRVRRPDGSWETVKNWYGVSQSSFADSVIGLQPTKFFDLEPGPSSMEWYPRTDRSEQRSWELFLTESAGFIDSTRGKLQGLGGEYVLVPTTVVDFDVLTQLGKLEEVYWFDNMDYGVSAKDRIIIDGVRYMVFQNCTHAIRNHFFAVKEA
ncbi:MAG: hypothetical protein GY934_05075 [Gammaproteobacteria bacterium]|nr:hypothetical protein [Gammaproteobacteria bacterium]